LVLKGSSYHLEGQNVAINLDSGVRPDRAKGAQT